MKQNTSTGKQGTFKSLAYGKRGCEFKCTVETLYSTIYYSKYVIELNFDKSTQYVAL